MRARRLALRGVGPARLLGLALVAAVAAAGAWHPANPGADRGDPWTYRLSPASRFDVLVEPAGIFGAFGHDHRIRARAVSGTIIYDGADVAASSVEITVSTAELVVLPLGADREDAPEVEAAMREEVLEVERFPTITFRSRSVAPIGGGARVRGDLTMVGRTRPVTVDVELQASPRRIVADARFSIRQTDWGIDPYRAALGTIRVADRVTFDVRAIGVR